MPIYEVHGGHPVLGRGAYLAEGARVIGDVELGEDASVWFGAVVRGDYARIRIGARTNVQDNSVVHIAHDVGPTTVGDDVTIGHGVVLHACTVGHRCLIGIGSIVLDGASIGEESFIGAGALVTPRTVIPPRSFVLGRPARVARATTDREVDAIRESAARYVQYAAEYLRTCHART